MLAIDVRHMGLGIATALVAAGTLVAAAAAVASGGSEVEAVMPPPSPETVAIRDVETAPIDCSEHSITTVVFHGTVHALDPDTRATFHFRFADLPARYSVMTGANGAFEVRIPRDELGYLDLCQLPSAGHHPAVFQDSTMFIEYELSFER